jgi:hypothetical protein
MIGGGSPHAPRVGRHPRHHPYNQHNPTLVHYPTCRFRLPLLSCFRGERIMYRGKIIAYALFDDPLPGVTEPLPKPEPAAKP